MEHVHRDDAGHHGQLDVPAPKTKQSGQSPLLPHVFTSHTSLSSSPSPCGPCSDTWLRVFFAHCPSHPRPIPPHFYSFWPKHVPVPQIKQMDSLPSSPPYHHPYHYRPSSHLPHLPIRHNSATSLHFWPKTTLALTDSLPLSLSLSLSFTDTRT
jgi:hypothetical protein